MEENKVTKEDPYFSQTIVQRAIKIMEEQFVKKISDSIWDTLIDNQKFTPYKGNTLPVSGTILHDFISHDFIADTEDIFLDESLKQCVCSMDTIMKTGCECGGI